MTLINWDFRKIKIFVYRKSLLKNNEKASHKQGENINNENI